VRAAASWLVQRMVQARFPGTQAITTAELAARLADQTRDPPLLIDVRERDEFAVSHLPGAVRLQPGSDPAPWLADIRPDQNRTIVLYCSVGYRSADMARRIAPRHRGEVLNLEGSIFAWANEGRPLVRDGEPAREVHPYDRLWGRLLRRELRAPLPPRKTAG
jgi:rhodanese-related sulfurtransferase